MVCRVSVDKSRLVRIARLADGTVAVDPSNKGPGRGAYVCRHGDCWKDPLVGRHLSRALRTSVPNDTINSLHVDTNEPTELSE